MRVLVTGADGFVARHLVPWLLEGGYEVVGTVRERGAGQPPSVPLHPLDITDRAAVRELVRAVRPTYIAHLAAVSSVRWSFAHPLETRQVNVEGARNVLQAAAEGVPPARVLVIGSGEEYGQNDGTPLPECPVAELRPLSPYAASKAEVERLVEAEPRFRAIAARTRSFPHLGPGQRLGFFTSDIASQLVRIERGETVPVLSVGNLDTVRDLADVRDVVRAYALLFEHGGLGEVYNVCTGRGRSGTEILDILVRLSGAAVSVERDPEKTRPSDIPVLVGDNTKLRQATGWSPEIGIEQSLRDVLAWWREQGSLSGDLMR